LEVKVLEVVLIVKKIKVWIRRMEDVHLKKVSRFEFHGFIEVI